jgi:hypothetical protein
MKAHSMHVDNLYKDALVHISTVTILFEKRQILLIFKH